MNRPRITDDTIDRILELHNLDWTARQIASVCHCCVASVHLVIGGFRVKKVAA